MKTLRIFTNTSMELAEIYDSTQESQLGLISSQWVRTHSVNMGVYHSPAYVATYDSQENQSPCAADWVNKSMLN